MEGLRDHLCQIRFYIDEFLADAQLFAPLVSDLGSSDKRFDGSDPNRRSSHSCITGLTAGSSMCFKLWKKLDIIYKHLRGWMDLKKKIKNIPSFFDAAMLQCQETVFDGEEFLQYSLSNTSVHS